MMRRYGRKNKYLTFSWQPLETIYRNLINYQAVMKTFHCKFSWRGTIEGFDNRGSQIIQRCLLLKWFPPQQCQSVYGVETKHRRDDRRPGCGLKGLWSMFRCLQTFLLHCVCVWVCLVNFDGWTFFLFKFLHPCEQHAWKFLYVFTGGWIRTTWMSWDR